MSTKKLESNRPENGDRLAQCALAAGGSDKISACPDDDVFARFLEAGPAAAGQQEMLDHISTCEACYQKWLSISEVLDSVEEKETPSRYRKQKLMAAVGSACVLTVGVMLYLSIDYQPMLKTEMDKAAPTGPEALSQDVGQADEAEGLAQQPTPMQNVQVLSEHDDQRFAEKAQRTVGTVMMEDQAGKGRQAEAPEPADAVPRLKDAEIAAEKIEETAEPAMLKERSLGTGNEAVATAAQAASDEALRQPDDPARFVEQFIVLCRDFRDNRAAEASVERLIEQGRRLRRSGMLADDEAIIVAEIIEVLERVASIEKHNVAETCEKAVEFGRRKGYDINNVHAQ